MKTEEKESLRQVKENLILMRLQLKIMSEEEFKKSLNKVLSIVDRLLDEDKDDS